MFSNNEIEEILSKINNLVIDFTAIINIGDENELKQIFDMIVEKSIEVYVSRDFYENVDIVMDCASEKQVQIAKLSKQFLELLKNKNKLNYFYNVTSARGIVKKLKTHNDVCFMFYCYSEFGEFLISDGEGVLSKSLIIDKDGNTVCCDTFDEARAVINRDVDPIAHEVDYFSVSFVPDVGQRIKTKDGKIITLTKFIGSGGEGSVYECDYETNYVVKIYNKGQLNRLRLKKLFLMEKTKVKYDGICWPEKVVYSQKGEPIGYLMQKAKGKPLSAVFDGCSCVLKAFPDFRKTNLIDVAVNVLKKIQYLHIFGIVLGDVRMKNIMIDKRGEICIVDIDSCQIGNLPCPIGFPDYTPPELQHTEFKDILRTYNNESFSCAVIMFKILFCGLHPYDQRNGADTLEEEIQNKTFPYNLNYKLGFSKIPIGSYVELWLNTPFQLQQLFYETFKEGKRITVTEMIMYLNTYKEFIELNKNKSENINRIFFDNK